MQLAKNVKRYSKLVLVSGFIPFSFCIYSFIIDHENRRLPLTEQTLLNFIMENGKLELIRKGPVRIDQLECNINQYKKHADICMRLETPSDGVYKYDATYTKLKGVWKLMHSSTAAVNSADDASVSWFSYLKIKLASS